LVLLGERPAAAGRQAGRSRTITPSRACRDCRTAACPGTGLELRMFLR